MSAPEPSATSASDSALDSGSASGEGSGPGPGAAEAPTNPTTAKRDDRTGVDAVRARRLVPRVEYPKLGIASRLFYDLCKTLLQFLSIFLFGIRVHHGHRWRPGALLAANHQSHLDPPLVGMTVKTPIHYLAQSGLFQGLLGKLISTYGAIPVDRSRWDRVGIGKAAYVLDRGNSLLLFPEGTRSWTTELQEIRRGFELLAKQTGHDVQPIVIHGSHQVMPRGGNGLKMTGGPIHIRYDEPISAAEIERWRSANIREALTQRWQAGLDELDRLRTRGGPGITTLTAPLWSALLTWLGWVVKLVEGGVGLIRRRSRRRADTVESPSS